MDIIREAVSCRFHSGGKTFHDRKYSSGWTTRPLTTFTHLLKGRNRITFDKSSSNTILRGSGHTTYLPAGVWRKTEGISQEGLSFIWVRVSFTIFGGMDLLSFFNVPHVFSIKYANDFRNLISGLLEFENAGETSLIRKAVKMEKYFTNCFIWCWNYQKTGKTVSIPSVRHKGLLRHLNTLTRISTG